MQEAIAQALSYRPDLEAYYYAVQQGKFAAKQQLSGYYPHIQMTSYLSQAQHQSSLKNGTEMRGDQLIYSWAGPLQAYKKAKKEMQVTECDREVMAQAIRYTVEKAFLETWFLQQQQGKFSSLDVSSKATFKRSKLEKNADLLDKKDWLRRVETHAVDASTIEGYSFDLSNAHKKLEFLIGTTLLEEKNDASKKGKDKELSFTTLQWETPSTVTLEKLETYYDLALKSRPEVKRDSKKIEVQESAYSLYRGQRLPEFAAYGRAGYDNQRVVDSGTTIGKRGDYTYHEFGFTMRWSIFDGLSTHYQEQQARVGKLKELLNREQTMINIKDQVSAAYYDVQNALTQKKAQKIKYMRAKNDFELNNLNFKQGLIAQDIYKQAETDWSSAQLDWLSINVSVAIKEQTLSYYCGYSTKQQ
jgi:outer membrane protein TolC